MDQFLVFASGLNDLNSPVSLLNRDILEHIILMWRKYETERPYDILQNGSEQGWLKCGLIHRDFDLPAIVSTNGSTLRWYRYGLLHRDNDKPALILKDELTEWYQNGRLHRDGDNPASIHIGYVKQWYKNGIRHRNGKPALISEENYCEWWINGELLIKVTRYDNRDN